MGAPSKPLISVGDLAALLSGTAERPALLDIRWELASGPGRPDYLHAHLPGAAFVDLDAELAGPPGRAGRHPLPDPAAFQAAMRRAGVEDRRPAVVYDAGGALQLGDGGCCATSATARWRCSTAGSRRGSGPESRFSPESRP